MLNIKSTSAVVVLETIQKEQELPIVFNFNQCEEVFFKAKSHTLILCVNQERMSIQFCHCLEDAKYFYLGYYSSGAV